MYRLNFEIYHNGNGIRKLYFYEIPPDRLLCDMPYRVISGRVITTDLSMCIRVISELPCFHGITLSPSCMRRMSPHLQHDD